MSEPIRDADPWVRRPKPMPGEIIDGRYRVEHLLGLGGYSTVVSARHVLLDRLAAIKMIRGDLPRIVQRFREEATLLACLTHPGLVRIYDATTLGDGGYYMALELVDGYPLDRLRRRQPIALRDALMVCEVVAGVLVDLHAMGILHRDIKPSNVMIPEVGNELHYHSAKLIDLGSFDRLRDNARLGGRQTRPGRLSGTPTHMAPEQLTGRRLSEASDIYALGATFYDLLFGAPPASDDGQICEFHFPAIEDVRIRMAVDRLDEDIEVPRRSDIPEVVRDVLTAMLRNDPNERMGSAVAARHAIQRLRTTLSDG
ncbi:MAG TPA: serine/threonine-protein kinase [Gemmatimonadaceae bacterium]|jgi:serine/threonine protein kinase|nr:serine/threonine-protein kinase [Gemmatimonadaceae bacterium]